ncbi:SDR family NAD(P)-dependent oxidoreductase, partial [Saccharothrix sp. MB29]|nr:SDR family NAD(P)-dependent oxidoreductase [Saccharothrix sp. MB29]
SRIPFCSTVTGDLHDTTGLDAAHWNRNLSEAVRFDRALDNMLGYGYRFFIEVSPRPALTMGMQDTFDDAGTDAVALGTLRRGRGGMDQFLTAVGQAWAAGVPVSWTRHFANTGARRIRLPDFGAARPAVGTAPVSPVAERVRRLPEADRLRFVMALVSREANEALGNGSVSALPGGAPFSELGLDSLTAVRLRDGLNAATGLSLPVTVVFDHATPAGLAGHVLAELTGADDGQVDVEIGTAADDDPVVIVGMSCRLPGGVDSPDALWDVVAHGVDVTSDYPVDRGWDADRVGAAATRRGGFLHDAGEFDATLFGISPREALAMDPQQRLLLEGAWELFERARIDAAGLRGSRTGVFIGLSGRDYAGDLSDAPDEVEGHLLTGTLSSVASGRIAYTFGLEGPALTVDTACSSSLVALHLAVRALRSGECSMAVAGGTTVMATPSVLTEFSRQGGLAADGRCKSFADAADGTGWAEGVGLLLVERLSDARRLGHEVLAVVRGSAVGSDGASNGLTAPSGLAQRRVIRGALADAGVRAAEVDVVEAHGTGTRLGDPIEAGALLATYGQDRERPLLLGSLKSNTGHTQAAAGVLGVIKLVLAMRHAVVPATLHVDAPSSAVDWSAGAVELATRALPWPDTGRPRRAAVSAFGVSGTNAHVVLEQAPPAEAVSEPVAPPAVLPLVLSARSPEALRESAARLRSLLDSAEPADVAWSLATTRTALDHRAVVVGRDATELATGLAAVGQKPAVAAEGGLALLFPGQGAQRTDMGRGLYEAFPVFAEAYDEVCAHVDPLLGRSLRGVDGVDLDRTGFAQPALFALGVASARLVASWGVRADAVMGHSVGEITAACVAGALSLPDAARLVTTRARLMQSLPTGGDMVAIEASERETTAWLVEGADIAAVNGPDAVVVSGERSAVGAVVERARAAGRRVTRLVVSHAFHSPLMDPVLADLERGCAGLEATAPLIPVISTLTGAELTDAGSPRHWARHAREAVRFADGVRALAERGTTRFLDLGPGAALAALVRRCAPGEPVAVAGRAEPVALVEAVGELYAAGVPVAWDAYLGGGRVVDLPTYPFQRRRYWLTRTPASSAVDTWLYREAWVPVTASAPPTGTWLVVSDGDDAGVCSVLARTARVVRRDGTDLTDLPALDGVISLLTWNDRPDDVVPAGLTRTTALLNALGAAGVDAPLWCVTRGACDGNPAQATTWGLGRVAALEHPRRWGGLIDLPAEPEDRHLEHLAAALSGTEDQVTVREGILGRRLRRTTLPGGDAWRPRGTVLITGGTGALGAHVARWAAGAGARHLVLLSRSGPGAEGADALVAELTASGSTLVTVVACDIADRDAVAEVLGDIPVEHPLTAVVHAAGVSRFVPLAGLDDLTDDLTAKVGGALVLDELTAGHDLDAFVLFSSGASAWGGGGQGAYAAANAHLDALARRRVRLGRPATALAWGGWAGGGMASDADTEDLLERSGLRGMTPELAITALARAVGRALVNVRANRGQSMS